MVKTWSEQNACWIFLPITDRAISPAYLPSAAGMVLAGPLYAKTNGTVLIDLGNVIAFAAGAVRLV
jgi:hypothetical protein